MENETTLDMPQFDPSNEVTAASKFVTVSNGGRRVEVPDGEGYLQQVESGPANDLPEGRYDLSKAIEARIADKTYEGPVLHQDRESIYQVVGKEVVKHGLFELAKEKLPEIGAQIAVSYAGGIPSLAAVADTRTAKTTVHPSKDMEKLVKPDASATPDKTPELFKHADPNAPKAGQTVDDVRKDLEKLFSHDPRGIAHRFSLEGDKQALLAGAEAELMQGKVNRSIEYAGELKRIHPDLFDKLASGDTKAAMLASEKVEKLVQVAERADQARTLTGKEAANERRPENSDEKKDVAKSAGDNREQEKRGFSMPAPIKTSVDARMQAARDMLASAQNLPAMVAAKQLKEHGPARGAATAKPEHTASKKRGMSR